MAIFVAADVQARLSTQAYARLYAKNGGSTVDATFLALCVAEAESTVKMLTRAAFPAGIDAAGGTVDVAIVGAGVDICNDIAASRHPSASEFSGYFMAGDRARKFLMSMNRDMDVRPVTSAAGNAKPRATNVNLTDSAGNKTNPLVRAADGSDSTGF